MPATTATKDQREIVRLLAIQHGLKKASELANIPHDVVRQWSVRGNWKLSQPVTHSLATVAAANVQSEIEKLECETRSSLARSAAKLARDSETAKLRDSANVKNVAQTAAIVHRWDAKSENTQNVVVNVALLGVQPRDVSVETLDVESGVSE